MSLIKNNLLKILFLWPCVLITFTISKDVPDSPCPEIFSYGRQDDQWCGFITRPSSPYGTVMTLVVMFSVGAYVVSGYSDNIEIVGGKNEAINSVLNGLPIVYKMCFSNNMPIPKLTKILFNRETVCRGPPEVLGVGNNGITAFTLGHYYVTGAGNQQLMPQQNQFFMDIPEFSQDREPVKPHGMVQTELPQFFVPESATLPQHSSAPQTENPQTFIRPTQPFMQHYVNRITDSQPPQNFAQSMDIPNHLLHKPQSNKQPKPQLILQDKVTDAHQDIPLPAPQHEVMRDPQQPIITTQHTGTSATLTETRHEAPVLCGRKKPNLLYVNGESYQKGDWPWLVAIYVQMSSSGLHFRCAGTLVSQRHTITAAHCTRESSGRTISSSKVVVKVGAFDLQDWTDEDVKQLGVKNIFQHPQYDGLVDNFNDISVIVTKKNVTFSDYIVPACLWDMDNDLNKIVGRTGTVVGWGQDEHGNIVSAQPRGGPAMIVSTESCRESLQEFQSVTSNTTICAGARDGSGPCNGDSGGGMYLYRNYRWYLRAIVSLSLTGEDLPCNVFEYTIYTDAAKYTHWIQSILEKT